ncbi:MAG: Low-potential cytochrome c [Candidatus Accumulibacter appositus]|uniref:Low-potential cytochrome c n=1 Tax=Candidatus Accumulibacter appositus TaxID=1454003 RepID=A0A011QU54_9PROT|nr:cytochrome c [Accumulibacter sp.]EXI82389.1 MAG: Low-potential cytochrome c [Candidatus Accumulibacter appositus]HRF03491.1 cytochrome c [Accumulibacter sp.]
MKKLMAVVVLASLAAAPVLAADDGAKLYAEKTCGACHGANGTKTLMPDYPKIAGQNAKYLEKQMLDIKTGARANGNSAAMKGVMPLVSDEQIKVLADYISKLKP